MVRNLSEAGIPVVVLDDLSTGVRRFVPDDVPFVEGTLLDGDLVSKALGAHDA